MHLALQELIPVGRAGWPDTGRDKRHILDAVRFELFEAIRRETAFKLEDGSLVLAHVRPDSLIVPVDLVRFRIGDIQHTAGVADDLNRFEDQEIVFGKATAVVNLFHVQQKTPLAVLTEGAVIRAERNRADDHARRVYALADLGAEEPVEVIEELRIPFLCPLRIFVILGFDAGADRQGIRVFPAESFGLRVIIRRMRGFPAAGQRTAYIVDDALVLDGAVGGDAGGFVRAEAIDNVFENLGSV